MQFGVDGRSVFLTRAGPPETGAPALVLLHGAGADHGIWHLASRALARRGWQACAPDLPGHGRSAGPALESVEALADWTLALMTAAGIERAALAGHSLGSLIALEAAARAPARVTTLALLGTSAPMPVAPALLEAITGDPAAARENIVVLGHAYATLLGGGAEPGIHAPNVSRRRLERTAPAVLHADMAACDGYDTGLEAAGRVACPCTLILGAEDRMTPPASARALAEALPAARVELIAGSGHMLLGERPEAVRTALATALEAVR